MTTEVEVRIHQNIGEMEQLSNCWDSLNDKSEASVFGTYAWNYRQFELHERTLVVSAWRANECVLILPVKLGWLSNKLKLQCIKHLATAYTDYQCILVKPSEKAAELLDTSLRALASHLGRRLPVHFANPSQLMKDLVSRLSGYRVIETNKWVHCEFDAAEAPLKSKLHREARRRKKKLNELGSIEIVIDHLPTEQDIRWVLAQNAAQYGSNRLTSSSHTDRTMALLRDVRSYLSFSTILLNSDPIYSHLGFTHKSKLQYYLLASDPQYKAYSPGIVLLNELVTSRSTTGIDYLRGEEDYKRHWSNRIYSDNGLLLIPPGLPWAEKLLARYWATRNQ